MDNQKRAIYWNRRAKVLEYNEDWGSYLIYYIDDGAIVETGQDDDDYEAELRIDPSDEEWEEAV